MLSRVKKYDKNQNVKRHRQNRALRQNQHKRNSHIRKHRRRHRSKKYRSRWQEFKLIVHRCVVLCKIGLVLGLILGSAIMVVLLINDLNIPEAIIIFLVGYLMIILWKKTA